MTLEGCHQKRSGLVVLIQNRSIADGQTDGQTEVIAISILHVVNGDTTYKSSKNKWTQK